MPSWAEVGKSKRSSRSARKNRIGSPILEVYSETWRFARSQFGALLVRDESPSRISRSIGCAGPASAENIWRPVSKGLCNAWLGRLILRDVLLGQIQKQ